MIPRPPHATGQSAAPHPVRPGGAPETRWQKNLTPLSAQLKLSVMGDSVSFN